MRKEKKEKTPTASSQSFYIDNVIYDLITMEADADERSKSYIVNKILKAHYQAEGWLAKEKKKKLVKPFKKS